VKHIDALDQAIEQTRIDRARGQGALIELCRTLARQMDAAGDDPSTRLVAAYLSALKDFRRAAMALPPIRTGPSKLDQLREARPRPEPSLKVAHRDR
jgi:hypothetical protein